MAPVSDDKRDLRRRLLARRRARPAGAIAAAGEAIAAHAAGSPALARPRRVAAHLTMPSEPPTAALLTGWLAAGAQVIVPIANDDRTLTWVEHDPEAPTRRSGLGIDEPITPVRAAAGLDEVDLVVVPALAVDHQGRRLGRGAGYYDRALAELPAGSRPLVCALVFTDEILESVPHEPHDVPVDLVLTEAGLFRPEPDAW